MGRINNSEGTLPITSTPGCLRLGGVLEQGDPIGSTEPGKERENLLSQEAPSPTYSPLGRHRLGGVATRGDPVGSREPVGREPPGELEKNLIKFRQFILYNRT